MRQRRNKKLKNKPGVYVIVNSVNNKKYVGSTRDIYKRKIEHWTKLKNNEHHNIHLQRAVNSYGIDSFQFFILEYVDDKNNLIKREQFWIDELDVCNKNKGYNILPTAFSQLGAKRNESSRKRIKYSQKSKPIIQLGVDGSFVKEWFSIRDILRNNDNYSSTPIVNRCKDKGGFYKDYFWIYKANYDIGNFNINNYKLKGTNKNSIYTNKKNVSHIRKVIQYSKDDVLIKEWNSISQASKELSINQTSISQCCRLKKKSAGGYIWRYKDYKPNSYYVYKGQGKYERRLTK